MGVSPTLLIIPPKIGGSGGLKELFSKEKVGIPCFPSETDNISRYVWQSICMGCCLLAA